MKNISIQIFVLFMSFCCYSQTHWDKYSNNPVLTSGVGHWDNHLNYIGAVLYYNNRYHIWYNAYFITYNFKVGYAESTDGINWIKYPDNPVFEAGPTGSWDDGGWTRCGAVTMVHDTLHMWYTSDDGSMKNWAIGHATSIDGLKWVRDPANPVFTMEKENEWTYNWIEIHEVVHDGNTYHMWYVGGTYPENDSSIGHATSPNGTVWTRDSSNPVLSPGSPGDWDYPVLTWPTVVYDGSSFHMFYCGGEYQGEVFILDIGYAFSQNGTTWTKYKDNPVMKRGADNQDSRSLWTPNVLIDSVENKFKIWYRSISSTWQNYSYAESLLSGIEDMYLPLNELYIYPNPANDFITIETGIPGNYYIGVTSINGQLLLNKIVENREYVLDLSSFNSGIYLITVRSDNFIYIKKIVKL